MQGGDDSIGDDSCTKGAGRGLGDPTIKDKLNLFGTTDVQVFSDDFFKEDAAAHGLIQNLSEGKFELENGELITVSGLTVVGGEGMGESSTICGAGRRSFPAIADHSAVAVIEDLYRIESHSPRPGRRSSSVPVAA